MKKSSLYIVTVILSVLTCSCGENYTYKNYRNIHNEEWCINNIPEFEVEINESGKYNIELTLRHTTDYEMANLWCFMEISDTSSIVLKDTVNLKLAETDGKWLGTGLSIKTVSSPANHPDIPLQPGKYTIRIQQGMRIKCLKGIRDIGVILRES